MKEPHEVRDELEKTLLPCPLCGEKEVRMLMRGCYHFAFEDSRLVPDDATILATTSNFLHSAAVYCSNCDLNLPSMDDHLEPAHELRELATCWNDRPEPKVQEVVP